MVLLLCLQEVKSLKSTIAKMESMARQKEALLADKTALVDRLQVNIVLWGCPLSLQCVRCFGSGGNVRLKGTLICHAVWCHCQRTPCCLATDACMLTLLAVAALRFCTTLLRLTTRG
jgi:hypothetical protein